MKRFILCIFCAACATPAPPPRSLAVEVDPYAPPAQLLAPAGAAQLTCNGKLEAVCWKRGDITRCFCGERS